MPATNPTVELFYSGAWHDITATDDVRTLQPITITSGYADQVSKIPPTHLTLAINDLNGKYSPRNPMSPLYGIIGRNTPIRVSEGGTFRCTCEVESWPQSWTLDGNNAWVSIDAYGIMRRYQAPGTTKPAHSPLRRTVMAGSPFAYWPMETFDAGDTLPTDTLLSPVAGVGPLVQTIRGASFGKGFAGNGSGPVVDFTTGGTLEAEIPDDGLFNPATGYTVEFVARYGNDNSSLSGPDISWITDGATGPTLFSLQPGPNMDLFFGTSAVFQGAAGGHISAYDGLAHHYRITVQQSGANIIINYYRDGVLIDVGDDFGGPDPLVTGTVNRPRRVRISRGNNGIPDDKAALGLGHVTFWHGVTPPDTPSAAVAYVGETAVERLQRLCTEEAIPLDVVGDDGTTPAMGVQRIVPVLDAMDDAVQVDGGILIERRDQLGLRYRCHTSLYNQASALDLTYGSVGEVAPDLAPVEDTAAIGNDITVTRYQGGFATAVQETGPLNVQEFVDDPAGVGRYKRDVTLTLQADDQTTQQAAWRRHLGTWDEARFPVVNLDLGAMVHHGKTALYGDALDLDVGDRFTIANPPVWVPPDSIDQHAQGFVEVIGTHTHTIAVNATPAGPYRVLELETDTTTNRSRIPAARTGTTTNEALDATETGVDIISAVTRWIDSATYPAHFPFDIMIGGERMRVTACTGTGLTQTFTVTRSINDVVKSHATLAPVQLFRPAVIAR